MDWFETASAESTVELPVIFSVEFTTVFTDAMSVDVSIFTVVADAWETGNADTINAMVNRSTGKNFFILPQDGNLEINSIPYDPDEI
jgi:hypothetical protein